MDQQQLRELLKAAINAPGATADRSTPPVGEEAAIHSAIRVLLELELQGNAKLLMDTSAFQAVWILPQLVLNRARTKGPDDAVRWLSKVLSATKVSVLRVMPLWGLEVSQPIDLTESIRLLPLSELPNLPQWSEPTGPRAGLDVRMYEMQPPKTALVARIVRNLIISGNDLSEYDFDSSTDGLLEELRLCLTLVAPCAIVPAAQQSLFEDSDFADLALFGGFSLRAMEVRPRDLVSLGVFNTERAQRLVRAYLALNADARGRIHLALDRFDRALRRHTPGDAAMELAISLDSLLGDSEGELTWKVSLRSALLVAGTKSERLERRAVIQAIYRLRSKVVHTGRTPTSIEKRGRGKLSPAELIPMAMITTAEVISAAINRGKLPDWFDEELGP
jgi:Apea-like HEPN